MRVGMCVGAEGSVAELCGHHVLGVNWQNVVCWSTLCSSCKWRLFLRHIASKLSSFVEVLSSSTFLSFRFLVFREQIIRFLASGAHLLLPLLGSCFLWCVCSFTVCGTCTEACFTPPLILSHSFFWFMVRFCYLLWRKYQKMMNMLGSRMLTTGKTTTKRPNF